MKTAIQFLKLVLFCIAIAWLASCNNKQHIVDEIYRYRDSIGIAQAQLYKLNRGADSIQKTYIDQYMPVAFSENEDKKRATWLKGEKIAYHNMNIAKQNYLDSTLPKKTILQAKIIIYRAIIDSLKLKLY